MNQEQPKQALMPRIDYELLQREYIETMRPHISALVTIYSQSLPVKIIVDTKTGSLTYVYDDITQSDIEAAEKEINDSSSLFMRTHNLVQS